MRETHDAIHSRRAANNRTFAGTSWEIYGDWSDDPEKVETTIFYLVDQNTEEQSGLHWRFAF